MKRRNISPYIEAVIRTSSVLALATVVAIMIKFFVPTLDDVKNILPVAKVTDFDIVERTPSMFRARVYGYKDRECAYIFGSENPFAKVDDRWMSAEQLGSLTFNYEITSKTSRPSGAQDMGIWRCESPHINKVTALGITVQHQCGSRIVATTMGPFEIGSPK